MRLRNTSKHPIKSAMKSKTPKSHASLNKEQLQRKVLVVEHVEEHLYQENMLIKLKTQRLGQVFFEEIFGGSNKQANWMECIAWG